ncbi:hypothetical protein DFP83_10293 [Idiomarina fontislapidosi]|nr:hypothetical protein DFP83_10293 [Idiomarina fontislapidosi]
MPSVRLEPYGVNYGHFYKGADFYKEAGKSRLFPELNHRGISR